MKLKIVGDGTTRTSLKLFTDTNIEILGLKEIKWNINGYAKREATIEIDSSEVAINLNLYNYTLQSNLIPLTPANKTRLRLADCSIGPLLMTAHDDAQIDGVREVRWEGGFLVLTATDFIFEVMHSPQTPSPFSLQNGTVTTSNAVHSSTGQPSGSGNLPSGWYGTGSYGPPGMYGYVPNPAPPPPDAPGQRTMDFDQAGSSSSSYCDHKWVNVGFHTLREVCSKCNVSRN